MRHRRRTGAISDAANKGCAVFLANQGCVKAKISRAFEANLQKAGATAHILQNIMIYSPSFLIYRHMGSQT